MRLVTYRTDNGDLHAGALVGDRVVDLSATDPSLPNSLRRILEDGPAALEAAAAAVGSPTAVVVVDAELVAPIPDPRKVLCIGLNYADHAAESGAPIPREPVVFNKLPTTVVGPGAAIELPAASQRVDFEAELVIVIGKRAKNVSEAEAADAILGFTCGNDVSARDWQLEKDGKQWLLGKSFDTFAPIGPAIVTREEVGNPHELGIHFRLNGQTMQDSTTAQMIFRVEQLVAYVSQVCTLEPGDLIFTGTPPGVGFARKPPILLKPGDVCEVEIEKVGLLRSPVVG